MEVLGTRTNTGENRFATRRSRIHQLYQIEVTMRNVGGTKGSVGCKINLLMEKTLIIYKHKSTTNTCMITLEEGDANF